MKTMKRAWVVSLLAAMAFGTLVAGDSGTTPTTTHKSTSKSSTTKPAAKSSGSTFATKQPVTISLTSTMRHGNLVVLVDNVPVFNEQFEKPMLIIQQTTTWDPIQVASGKHKLTAKVYGTKGRTFVSNEYNLEISKSKGIELRFKVSGDKVTVEPTS